VKVQVLAFLLSKIDGSKWSSLISGLELLLNRRKSTNILEEKFLASHKFTQVSTRGSKVGSLCLASWEPEETSLLPNLTSFLC
jgi:hypothetical protein